MSSLSPLTRNAIFGKFLWGTRRILRAQIPMLREPLENFDNYFENVEFYEYVNDYTIIIVDQWRFELTPQFRETEILVKVTGKTTEKTLISKLKVKEIVKNFVESVLNHRNSRIGCLKSSNRSGEENNILPLIGNATVNSLFLTSHCRAPMPVEMIADLIKLNPNELHIMGRIFPSDNPHLQLTSRILKIEELQNDFAVFMQFVQKLHEHQPTSFYRLQEFGDRKFASKSEFLSEFTSQFPDCYWNERNFLVIPILSSYSSDAKIHIQVYKKARKSEEIVGACATVHLQ